MVNNNNNNMVQHGYFCKVVEENDVVLQMLIYSER